MVQADEAVFESDEFGASLGAEVFGTVPPESPARVYLLLDAAQATEIPVCVESLAIRGGCLFQGAMRDELGDVAPWLAEVGPGDDMWDWYLDEGFGRNRGVVLAGPGGFDRVRLALKRSLMIRDENGRSHFFKFYLPKVFNTYVPAFDAAQFSYLMHGLSAVWAEVEGKPGHVLRHRETASGAERVQIALKGARPQ